MGVYVRATSSHLFVPPALTKQNLSDLSDAMEMEPIEITIGGSNLVGSLMAANKNGAVVADMASEAEMDILRGAGLKVFRLERSRLNAAGNNVLCNDHGAIAHPQLSKNTLAAASEALGVDVVHGTIAEVVTVGTAAIATNRGVLTHPLATDEDRSFIKKCLHATARIGTVNHGHGLVGAGLAANQNGAATGSRTTGIELGRIEEALGFLE